MKKDKINYLLSWEHKIFKHKRLASSIKEDFLLLSRHNDRLIHLFCTCNICEYLERGIKTTKYVTKKPAIIFKIGKKKYAIDIETGSMLTRRKALIAKGIYLDYNYNGWIFIVTKRKNVKKCKEIGNSIDIRYIKNKLDKILKSKK